ncbi:hypothetical protein [Kiloniella sp. EL199]|uniref:hypothetical protein n=1 Tax=Kiloniella sp. EL199 TaxID=2107581 RepID=UPI000EA3D39C|nr:hypothetical protein [Kiloniella sp. EL199]
MQPLFIATERFGPWDGKAWVKYIEWSKLTQLKELVSLDGLLCEPVLSVTKDEYWPYIVNEDYMSDYFTDLNYFLNEVSEIVNKNILCVFKNPISSPKAPSGKLKFEFLGYDLVDLEGSVSALSNCGGFPLAFSNEELNQFGLLESHDRAAKIRILLKAYYPEERHAACHLWAIFRARTS